jgi:hypothetical protein
MIEKEWNKRLKELTDANAAKDRYIKQLEMQLTQLRRDIRSPGGHVSPRLLRMLDKVNRK